MIKFKTNYLKTLHYLSLDVVVGAVASCWMFWKMPQGNGKVDIASLLILGICTWIIYILDRLIDNIKNEPTDARHQFHFQHQYFLQVTIIILFFIASVLVFFLPKRVIYFGIGFSVILALYFYVLHKTSKTANYHYFKELFTSAIYSICIIGSAFCAKRNLEAIDYLIGFNFFLLVHQSILAFSFYEVKEKNDVKNLAKKLGEKYCTYSIFGVTTFIMLSYFSSNSAFIQKVILIESLMAVCSTLIFVFHRKLSVNESYRWLGEMVFWLPILLVFF